MTDDQINGVVHDTANEISAMCGDDPESVICVAFGLLAHCAHSFDMKHDVVHQVLAEMLAQATP